MKIAVLGATGRMGKILIQKIQENNKLQLEIALEREGNEFIGQDSGIISGIKSNGILISKDMTQLNQVDIVIDFTHPDATMKVLPICLSNKIKMIIGTTGFNSNQLKEIKRATQEIAIVKAANFSIGVNLCLYLTEKTTKILTDSDVEIIEAHHKNKIDAPSGTALAFGEAVAKTRGVKLNDVAVYERFGQIGARKEGEIGFATIRSSDIVGEHTISFGTIGERVEITHKAVSRSNFANGAVFSALWIKEKGNGLFDMQDVLNLKN